MRQRGAALDALAAEGARRRGPADRRLRDQLLGALGAWSGLRDRIKGKKFGVVLTWGVFGLGICVWVRFEVSVRVRASTRVRERPCW